MKGKYIYGIIKGNDNIKFSNKGLYNKRPYALNYKNISAIITDAPIITYEPDQKGLLSHNRVLDEAIKSYSVLPLRFGTIARTESEVKNLLQSAYSLVLNKLNKIENKTEFDITITISNEQQMIKTVLSGNKEIRDFRDKLLAKGSDAGIEDKLLIGKMLATEVEKYKTALIRDIIKTLSVYSIKHKQLTGRDVLSSIAFLVSKRKLDEFEASIYKLGDKYGDMLKFKYTGPLAPYNFVEMKLILVNFNTVNNARKQLGLNELAALKDIKNAYRKMAQEFHPDLNPGDKIKEEEFKKIDNAYKLLYEYCRHYPKKNYTFTPEAINEFSILVEE